MKQLMNTSLLYNEAIELLKQLIRTPSFSKEEHATADILYHFLLHKEVTPLRYKNNVWAKNKFFNPQKPTLLLNSHHDTVKPHEAYLFSPFEPVEKDGKLYGLGSNDAGGCLVALLATFIFYYNEPHLNYNLIFAASAEEEISGSNGIEALLPQLPAIDCGIVGEPTCMNMAIAEKGLLVLDCKAIGKAGHAAREEGINAIDIAINDIDKLKQYCFEKISPLLGKVKWSVTIIHAGTQHNVIPHECLFTIDVRINELYTLEEIIDIFKNKCTSIVQPRSMRLRSTSIALTHPLVQSGLQLGKKYFGSPTTSDKALMNFPTLKMGPGNSARSHTANEFIYLEEIQKGIEEYIQLLQPLLLNESMANSF